jgi:hypothetical protein
MILLGGRMFKHPADGNKPKEFFTAANLDDTLVH